MEYVLGVDIGTGSVKAVAVDLQCQSFEEYQLYYPYSSTQLGYHEQDPGQIWLAFVACLKGIVEKIGSPPLAIGLSSAMHSMVAVDADCVALAPMMTWADNRSFAIARRLRESADGLAIYEATGTPLHAMSPLCKLIWLRENNAALFNNAYKFISIKEYIWYQLFGEFKIDHSIASGTGLFNITTLEWHLPSLQKAGISALQLSDPVPTEYISVFQPSADKTALNFLNTGTSFNISASDGCLANLGSMATAPGIASLTIGTSGAVRVASNKPLPNKAAMTFSYLLNRETFICGGPLNNGGIAFQWWLKNCRGNDISNADYDMMFRQIANVPAGSAGLIFLPYLSGERAPIWDSESCGNFFGIGLQHTQAHFSRAVMEGICYALKDVLDAVEQNAEPVTRINVSGGFASSAIWLQTLADITGKLLAVVQTGDASAVGAAMMALKNTGLITDYPSTSSIGQQLFEPNPKTAEVYARGLTVYRKLYMALKDTMHNVYEAGMR